MVKKKVALIGVSDKGHPDSRSVNTGNIMHSAAGRRIVGDYKELSIVEPWSDAALEELNSEYSHIVYIAANALRLGTTKNDVSDLHKTMTDNISKTNLPTVVFGLGAQGTSVKADRQLPKNTVYLLHMLGERSKKIAVRGQYTADILNELGVDNPEVLGCPSNFWHMSPHFAVALKQTNELTYDEVAYNYTGPRKEWPNLKHALESKFDFIGQEHVMERDLQKGVYQEAGDFPYGVLFENEPQWQAFKQHIEQNFHMYYTLDHWFEAMQKYRFCYGTRFHGNMVALQSGVKALWLTHDTRTKELCEYHGLPSLSIQKAAKITHVQELAEHTDYSEYVSLYQSRYKRFWNYLEEAELPHQLPEPWVSHDGSGDDQKSPMTPTDRKIKQLLAVTEYQSDQIDGLMEEMKGLRVGLARIGRLLTTGAPSVAPVPKVKAEPAPEAKVEAEPAGDVQKDSRRNVSRTFKYDKVEALIQAKESGIEQVLQTETNTAKDRYAVILKAITDILGEKKGNRILSFGCSSGEETETFAAKYFTDPSDEIVGCDINQEMLDLACENNPDPERISYLNSKEFEQLPKASFDVVFAMSVLCAWPMAKNMESISNIFPFYRFEKILSQLDEMIKEGGYLVIYNSNYRFMDSNLANKYEVVHHELLKANGFVKMFDVSSQAIENQEEFVPIIYRKKSMN